MGITYVFVGPGRRNGAGAMLRSSFCRVPGPEGPPWQGHAAHGYAMDQALKSVAEKMAEKRAAAQCQQVKLRILLPSE